MVELIAHLLADTSGVVLEVFAEDSRLALRPWRANIRGEGVCSDGFVVSRLRLEAPHTTWWHDDPISMQLPRRYQMVVLSSSMLDRVPQEHRRALVHNAVQHLGPSGHLVASLSIEAHGDSLTLTDYDELCRDCDLSLISRHRDGSLVVTVSRRTDRFTIHDLVYEARQFFARTTSAELAMRLEGPQPPLVVDTRTQTDRARFGVIAGSIHVPRTVLEWHLDPANGYRHPSVTSLHQPIVVVCNRGYSSSLAAASLVRLGFSAVHDLVGGVHAWIDQGYPVELADHDHLDL